ILRVRLRGGHDVFRARMVAQKATDEIVDGLPGFRTLRGNRVAQIVAMHATTSSVTVFDLQTVGGRLARQGDLGIHEEIAGQVIFLVEDIAPPYRYRPGRALRCEL